MELSLDKGKFLDSKSLSTPVCLVTADTVARFRGTGDAETHTKRAPPWLTVVSERFGEHTPPSVSVCVKDLFSLSEDEGIERDTGRETE